MPIELTTVSSGYNLSVINDNFQTIEDAWDEKLDRLVSDQGNQMEQDLDMNGNTILNVPISDDPNSLVVKKYVDSLFVNIDGAEGVVPFVQPRQQGDGVTTVFAAPNTSIAPNNSFLVSIDGVTQRPLTDFASNGVGSIVFTEAPPLNSNIDITFYQPATLGLDQAIYNHTWYPWGTSSIGDNVAVVGELYRYGVGSEAVYVYTNQFGVEMGAIPGSEFEKYRATLSNVTELQEATFLLEGQAVTWSGYNEAGDGGGNSGVVKVGTHVEDGGSIFTIDGDKYVEADYSASMTPMQYGAFPGVGGDTSTRLARLKSYFANTGIVYEFPENEQFDIGIFSTNEQHFQIVGRDSFVVIGNNSEIICESSHATTPQNVVFYFEDTNNIDVEMNCDGVSVVRDGAVSGTELFYVYNNTENTSGVKLKAKCKNMFRVLGSGSSDPAAYRTSNIHIDLACDFGYYNVNLVDNLDILTGNIVSNDMVRSYFPYGVTNHNVKVTSSNHYKFTDILIKSYEFNTSNIHVDYTLNGSATTDAVCTVEHQSDTQDKSIEDITFDVNLNGLSSYPFTISQFNAAGVSQSVTDSVISNINYRGAINGRSLISQNYNITVAPTGPSLLRISESLNPLFDDMRTFSVITNGKLYKRIRGDLNGSHQIPIGFLKGSGWGATMHVHAIQNQAATLSKSIVNEYSIVGATANPSPATIGGSNLYSQTIGGGPIDMTLSLSDANIGTQPGLGLLVSNHPVGNDGFLFIELEFIGGRFLEEW